MSKLFDIKYMELDLNEVEKMSAIGVLASLIREKLVDVDKYVDDVRAREEIGTTGIGDGVAIPHAKSSWVKEPVVAVGKISKGIDWNSLDGEPVKIIFLIAVPEGGGNEHLKILQVLAVSLMNEEFKEKIFKASDKKVLEELLNKRTQQ